MVAWQSTIHFYQFLTVIFFTGFIVYMVLYFNELDSNRLKDYAPSGSTDCMFQIVYPRIVKNPFNNPYSMSLDHSSGQILIAHMSEEHQPDLVPVNLLYNLDANTGEPTFVEQVAPNIRFNTNQSVTIQQTVVAESLNILTNGTYFWNLETASSFTIDSPPIVPSNTDPQGQTMVAHSAQEWNNGFVTLWIVQSADNSPPGSQARLTVYQLVNLTWYTTQLSPLDATIAGLGQFGFNRFSVHGASICFGTSLDVKVFDYSPASLTWSQTESSDDLLAACYDCYAYVLTSNGTELFVLTVEFRITQLQRLFTDPAKPLAVRQFYKTSSYSTDVSRSSTSFEMRATEFALIIADRTRYIIHYRKDGYFESLKANPTIIDIGLVNPLNYQWNVVDLSINHSTKNQYLSIPYTDPDTQDLQDGQVSFWHDVC